MKVYVLETDVYDNRDIFGIYATAEAAMAAWHPDPKKLSARNYRGQSGWTYQWKKNGDSRWEFGADWQHAASVTAYEVKEAA